VGQVGTAQRTYLHRFPTSHPNRSHDQTPPNFPLCYLLSGNHNADSEDFEQSAGSEVLINSPTCGFWEFNSSAAGEVFQWDLKTLNESITAANYANTCYGTGNRNSPLCDTYIVPEV
jgi:hypothetical protein